jgi:hypothetical protein
LNLNRYPKALENLKPPEEKRIIIKIKPEKILYFALPMDEILGS